MALRGAALAAMMLVCATTGVARAEDQAAGVHILTPGKNPSCGDYTTERAFPTRGQQFQFWALGFLSGVNMAGNADTEFLAGFSGEALLAWLDNYCREHPLDQFPVAVTALYRELVTRRSRK
jgi:hypothetical protein